MDKEKSVEKSQNDDRKVYEYGQILLDKNSDNKRIHLMSIIGEIEGHECLSSNSKSTKYEHVIPQLASIDDNSEIDGVLFLINTVGGDVSAGLAIAELIASMSKPTVALVLGDCHSIGVPLVAAANYSFIVPTGTIIIHPVRMNGTIIGAPQTYDYFQLIQDRIVGFIATHTNSNKEKIVKMMLNTGILTKDLGTILVGEQCVEEGIVNQVGGIKDALLKLKEMINQGLK